MLAWACGGLGARDLGSVQAFGDPLLALIQHLEDRLVEHEPEDHEEHEEVRDLRDQLGQIEAEGVDCLAHTGTSFRLDAGTR